MYRLFWIPILAACLLFWLSIASCVAKVASPVVRAPAAPQSQPASPGGQQVQGQGNVSWDGGSKIIHGIPWWGVVVVWAVWSTAKHVQSGRHRARLQGAVFERRA